jgi:ABC-type transport system involved in multi-copper enzyme maturation permease subunit
VIHLQHRGPVADADLDGALSLYLQTFVVLHFVLVALATPAFLAGAVTDEKVQGTLQLLLTTDLKPVEILLGKLLGRVVQLGLLVLVGLPLLCFVAAYYGALGVSGLLGLILLTLGVLFALGGVSLWESVRSRQTRDAALRLYVYLGLGSVGVWAAQQYALPLLLTAAKGDPARVQTLERVSAVLRCLNPVYVLGPAWGEGGSEEYFRRLRVALALYAACGTAFLALAVWRLRPLAIRYLEGVDRLRRKAPVRPAVDDEPVRWRERTAGRRLARWAAVAVVLAATTAASYWFYQTRDALPFLWQAGVAGLLASLVIGIRASGAVSGERERKTWESLLLTPTDTWELVVDKRLGLMEWMYPYCYAFALPALGFALALALETKGLDAVAFTGGMLLLGWTAMYYMASTGIWCSVSSRSSWRSLVATVGTGYGYCLVIVAVVAFAYLWLGCIIVPIFLLVLSCFGVKTVPVEVMLGLFVVTCLLLGWLLLRKADTKLWYAQAWIDNEERYGRTLTRSLARALRKHYERLEERRRATSGVAS